MLEQTLKKIDLGLSDKEVKVYLALLKTGETDAARLAAISRLKRTTVYGILKTLKEKGLASEVESNGQILFKALEPRLLVGYVERLAEEMLVKKQVIKKILPQLEGLRKQAEIFPSIQFFEGVEGVKQVYEDTIDGNKGKVLYDFTGVESVLEILGHKWLNYYLKKRVAAGIKCFDVAADSAEARQSQSDDNKYLRTTVLIPREYDFGVEIDVYDNKIAIFSFSEDRPIAILIESGNIAQALKNIFKYVFDMAKQRL